MTLAELKLSCNRDYQKCIDLLEQNGSLNDVHNLLLSVCEKLVKIGQMSPQEVAIANRKAIRLFKIAKSITKDTTHDNIYYALLGKHLEIKNSEIEEEFAEEPCKEEAETSEPKVQEVTPFKTPAVETKNPLRPLKLDDYIGQKDVRAQLNDAICAARIRGVSLKHIILFGGAGLGKTTLARIIANEMNAGFIEMNGPSIRDVQGFVNVISKVKDGDVVFIDEIHRLPIACAESLYSAMEDYRISYMAKNPKTGLNENITLDLPRFTVVGATTHSGMLAKPLLDRFVLQFHLKPYTEDDMCEIIQNSFNKLNIVCTHACAMEIAKRSRAIPRKANAYVEQLSDRAVLENTCVITMDMVENLFKRLQINEEGLDSFDMSYLYALKDKYGGGPVGLDSLCACLSVDKNIVENQIEPYLLFKGFIMISSSGRNLSDSGRDYLVNKEKAKEALNNKNFFMALLNDNQYEQLIIKLCTFLENLLKDSYKLVGTLQEMMDTYCAQNCGEETTALLNKLRMKRNDLIHSDEVNIDMTDEEIVKCIEYICGMEG